MVGRSIGTGWAIITCLSILTVLIGLLLSGLVPHWFPLETGQAKELGLSIFLAAVGSSLVFFAGAPGVTQQALQRSEVYLLVYITGWIVGIISIVVFLFKGMGLISIPLGNVVSGLLWSFGSSLDVIYFTKKKLGISIGWCARYLREIKGLIGATFLNQTGRILARSCDAFFVGIFLGLQVVPVVVFTSKLWTLAISFGQRISVAFVPGLAHLWGEGDKNKAAEIYTKVLRVTIWFVAFEAATLVFLNRTFIGLWVGRKFFAGNMFNLLMSLSVFFYVYSYALGQILFSANIIKGPALAIFIQNVAYLVLLTVLLKVIGIVGIPVAMIIPSTAVILVYLQKRIGLLSSLALGRLQVTVLRCAILGISLGVAGTQIIQVSTWINLVSMVVVMAVIYVFVLALIDNIFRNFVIGMASRAAFRMYGRKRT
jgi:O-antigen/teichoic acid export membrane protein